MSSPIRRPLLRLLPPLMLILLGMWLLSGCVFIPTFGVTTKGRNAADAVGGKNSWSKLKTDRATMADVVGVLGPPPYASPDGRQIGYTWQQLNGFWVWPMCFAAQSDHSHRALVLTFDDQQVLRDFYVSKEDDGLQSWFEPSPAQNPMPSELLPTGAAPDANDAGPNP